MSDRERHRENQKKAKQMGSERWPQFIGRGRLGAASQRSGGAWCYRFNECKRGRRGLPLMLSSTSEDARNWGSTSHCGPWQRPWHTPRREAPGAVCLTRPTDEAFVVMARYAGAQAGHTHSHIWRQTQIRICYTHLMDLGAQKTDNTHFFPVLV